MKWSFWCDPDPTPSLPYSSVRIRFGSDVAGKMTACIRRFPTVEVGGKLVGFVNQGGPKPQSNVPLRSQLDVNIVDYIDSGPNAQQSATFLMPDGDYQADLFDRIASKEPKVFHLGSWHSHHCNGLNTLSNGDVRTYTYYVNHKDHELNFFIASLITDMRGFPSSKHFLFFRGIDSFYECQANDIEVYDGISPFSDILCDDARYRSEGSQRFAQVQHHSVAHTKSLVVAKAMLEGILRDVHIRRRGELLFLQGQMNAGEDRLICKLAFPADRSEPILHVSRDNVVGDAVMTLRLGVNNTDDVMLGKVMSALESLRDSKHPHNLARGGPLDPASP